MFLKFYFAISFRTTKLIKWGSNGKTKKMRDMRKLEFLRLERRRTVLRFAFKI